MFNQISEPLVAQAYRIARGNQDHAQDILAMAYSNHRSASSRGKELSIGELVTFMKHRCGELRQGKRLPFGNKSGRSTGEVYRVSNYLNGNVELLSLNFTSPDGESGEDAFDGHGQITAMIATRDICENVLFEVGMEGFLACFSDWVRRAFLLKVAGYTYKEIARRLSKSPDSVRCRLRHAGRQFIAYFELPPGYLVRYGLA